MLHPSTKKLIDRLVEMTSVAKIDWQESESGAVVYTTEGYSVTLEQDPNELVITSVDGRELERATAEELAEVTDGEGTTYTARVAEMTREAVRKAKGIDTAISTLLAGIDTDGDGIPNEPAAILSEEVTEEPTPVEDSIDESAASATMDVEVETNEDVAADMEAAADPDMTEAVARLADEVNGRDEASDTEAVEVSYESDEAQNDSVDAEEAAEPETVESVASEQDEAVDDVVEEFAETLHADAELTTPAASEVEETETVSEDESEDQSFIGGLSATAAGIATSVAMAERASDEVSSEEAADVELSVSEIEEAGEPVITAAEADAEETVEVSEESNEPEVIEAPVSFADDTEVSDTVEETVAFAELEASETVNDAFSTIDQAANDDVVEEVSFSSEPVTEVAASAFDDATESEAEEAASEPENTLENGISLSSIGAGFGLGALQMKGEASGVPGPATEGDEQIGEKQETILIDATDDVPLSPLPEAEEEAVETVLPEVADLQAPEPEAETVAEEVVVTETVEEAETSEEDGSLTPRTRFNPWT